MQQKTKLLIIFAVEFVLVGVILLLIFFAGKQPKKITFDLNGGSLVSGDLIQEVEEWGDAVSPVTERNGYVFSKWDLVSVDNNNATYKAVWTYDITEGFVYNVIEGSDYCTIKSCYKELYGDVYISDYYGDFKILGIEAGAFKDCKYIENIYLQKGIIIIGEGAFEGCSSLKSITIPDTVRKIEANAFKDCAELETVNLGKSLTMIGDGAFDNCTALSEVLIPSGVTEIGLGAFNTDNIVINVYFKEGEIPSGWNSEWILSPHTINYEYVNPEQDG